MTSASGILVVDKPSGMTSHAVVARERRRLGTRKIGHAGTLDPMATGVLVLGVNRATRLLGHLMLTTKRYEATIRLGVSTTTDDADGEVTAAPGASTIAPADVTAALPRFRGVIRQVPSAVSAIKVDGRRAYALARRGEPVDLAAREVTVSRFDCFGTRVTDADGVAVLDVDVVVECSSGTYVRALARDLGAALGTGGHLTALRRTRVGPFDVTEAGEDLLGLADVARRCFPCLEVDAAAAADVSHGRPLDQPVEGPVTAVLHSGALLALYAPRDGTAVPVAVLAPVGLPTA